MSAEDSVQMLKDSYPQFDYEEWEDKSMTEAEARDAFEIEFQEWEAFWTKRMRAETVSKCFTTVFGAAIVLASFVMVFVVAVPWLEMWSLIPASAYIIGFFAMLAEEKPSGFT